MDGKRARARKAFRPTLSFLRSKINKQKTGGFGGATPPIIVPGTASRAAGSRGGPSPSCGLRFLYEIVSPGLRVSISRPRTLPGSLLTRNFHFVTGHSAAPGLCRTSTCLIDTFFIRPAACTHLAGQRGTISGAGELGSLVRKNWGGVFCIS